MSNSMRDAAREAARSLYKGIHGLRVEKNGNVTPLTDGGAFVEAQVWVPQYDIDVTKVRMEAEAEAEAEAKAKAAAEQVGA